MVDKEHSPRENGKKGGRAGTRAFFAEARREPEVSRFDALHGYVYIRWPYTYISMAIGEHPLARVYIRMRELFIATGDALRKFLRLKPRVEEKKGTLADGYHGKVLPLGSAKQLVSIKEDVELRNLEHIIPFEVARDLVLKNPDHIAVIECPCREARADGCQPLDVCLVVGEPFASFAVESHPDRARWIDAGEAAEILQAEHERGHVHHAFFKDAMLGRFYAICNCCACCCGAMQANRHGTPMSISSGYVSRVEEAACIGCLLCIEDCPFSAIAGHNGMVRVDKETCMGCGVCVTVCDQEALTLVRDPGKPEPLVIEDLMRQAASR